MGESKSTPESERVLPRVLVVDDMEENRKLLKAFLTHMGFATDIATWGEEALKCVEESPPDVILLDLVMPALSGFEVCKVLKGNSATRHIPIIIITGMSDRDANVMALEAGANDFVLKPFDSVLLKARLQSAIQTKQLQDELLRYQHDLKDRVKERTRQVERSQQATVFSLAKLSESRDNETGDHLGRMRSYACVVATELVGWDKFQGIIDDSFVVELYE